MAPKRLPTSSGPRTPKAKKAKKATGQKSLHSFFRSPSKSAEGTATTQGHADMKDRELAEQLARNDGIDLETAERLEASWKNARASSTGINTGTSATDAIAVDLDVTSGPGVDMESVSSISNATPKKSDILPRSQAASGSKPMSQTFIPTVSRPIDVTPQSSASVNYPDLSVDPAVFTFDAKPPWFPAPQAPYSFLSHALSILSQTRSRILILNTLTNYLRLISLYDPQSLASSLYLLSSTLAPPYLSVELGLGHSIISKSIQQVSGLTSTALSKLYKALGDPGDVAFTAKSSVRTLIPHPALTVVGVYDTLLKISRVQGQGAARIKQSLVEKLLLSAKGEEPRYLVRTLCQHLRVGAVRNTIVTALARSMAFSPPHSSASTTSKFYASPELLKKIQSRSTNSKKKSVVDPIRQELTEIFGNAETVVKRCFVQHPNLDNITAALLEVGLEKLAERVPLAVGVPLHPTLGSSTRSWDEVYERLNDQPFAAEFKYDGQRAQLHASRSDGTALMVKLFSRHLEDMTGKYPDVIALMERLFMYHPDLSSFIIDAEIVAVDIETGTLKSFQDLSQRARKDVRLEDVKVAVCLFVYDLMYLNGTILLEMPFRQRRDLLRTHFPPVIPDNAAIARLEHVESCDSDEGRDAMEKFWQKAVAGRSEGLMIKLLDHGKANGDESPSNNGKSRKRPLPASYEPDKRTLAWLKLKKDYVTGLGDSLDLVPIGAWHGNGRKADWWSPVLLALWDETAGEFVAVCKCMSGFSDVFYKDMKERYTPDSDTCSSTPLWNCRLGSFKPTVYFKPSEVWEVLGADITSSPVSIAALGLIPGTRGLSLRFPRFIRIREDKGLEQASTPRFLADMWQVQEKRGKEGKEMDEEELLDVNWESDVAEEDSS